MSRTRTIGLIGIVKPPESELIGCGITTGAIPGSAAGCTRDGINAPNPPKRLERVLYSPSPVVGREDEEAPDGADAPDVVVTSIVGMVGLTGWVGLIGRVSMDVTDDIGLSNTCAIELTRLLIVPVLSAIGVVGAGAGAGGGVGGGVTTGAGAPVAGSPPRTRSNCASSSAGNCLEPVNSQPLGVQPLPVWMPDMTVLRCDQTSPCGSTTVLGGSAIDSCRVL